MPKSRIDYWGPKIAKNRERDARNVRRLRRLGWTAITVWECDIGKAGFLHKLVTRIAST